MAKESSKRMGAGKQQRRSCSVAGGQARRTYKGGATTLRKAIARCVPNRDTLPRDGTFRSCVRSPIYEKLYSSFSKDCR